MLRDKYLLDFRDRSFVDSNDIVMGKDDGGGVILGLRIKDSGVTSVAQSLLCFLSMTLPKEW